MSPKKGAHRPANWKKTPKGEKKERKKEVGSPRTIPGRLGVPGEPY